MTFLCRIPGIVVRARGTSHRKCDVQAVPNIHSLPPKKEAPQKPAELRKSRVGAFTSAARQEQLAAAQGPQTGGYY